MTPGRRPNGQKIMVILPPPLICLFDRMHYELKFTLVVKLNFVSQIQSLPAKLPGKCIHSHMAAKQKQALKEEIAAKKVPLLLLSPEALIMGNFG